MRIFPLSNWTELDVWDYIRARGWPGRGSERATIAGLVDARNGITVQTYRHTGIAALLGIRRVLLVVNKLDLVGFAQSAFAAICDRFDASPAAGHLRRGNSCSRDRRRQCRG
jgi:hypothetical protein